MIRATVEKHGPQSVVVSSFTKAAASEIASRDLGDLPSSNVGTLHALCYRALGKPRIAESKLGEWNEHVSRSSPEFALSKSRGESVIDDPYGAESFTRATEGDETLQRVNLLRARLVPRERWPEREVAFDEAWRAWKREADYLDFTDLIDAAFYNVQEAPGGARFGFFDECQDWSPMELRLVRSWANTMEGILLCYDPDQTLYTFKGATPRALESAEVPEENYSVLAQSYRVPRAVHAVARAWIRGANRRPRDWEYHARDFPGHVGTLAAPAVAPAAVIDAVEDDLLEGRTAMLLASCSFQLQPLVAEMRRRGLPFHNPYRKTNGAWNPMSGGTERVAAFLKPLRPDMFPDLTSARTPKPRLWTWAELWKWVDLLRVGDHGVVRGMKTIVEANAHDANAARRQVQPEDVRALLGEQNAGELRAAMRTTKPWRWLEGRMLPPKAQLVDYALRMCEQRTVLCLSVPPRVVVGTVHSVKGGQSDSVYLSPDLSPAGYGEWLSGGDEQDSVRRMFYVGMTRARERLTFLAPSSGMSVEMPTTPR